MAVADPAVQQHARHVPVVPARHQAAVGQESMENVSPIGCRPLRSHFSEDGVSNRLSFHSGWRSVPGSQLARHKLRARHDVWLQGELGAWHRIAFATDRPNDGGAEAS